jgi:hypothetical protein
MENFAQLTKQMSWRYVTVYCFLLLYIYIYFNSSWVLKFGVTTWDLKTLAIVLCSKQIATFLEPNQYLCLQTTSVFAIGYQHCYQEVSWRNLAFLSIK